MQIQHGQILNNRFEILGEIGRGGFSRVLLVSDTQNGNKEVALKLFADTTGLDTQTINEVKKEFEKVQGKEHPNILAPYEFGHIGSVPYLVMDYADGGNLRRLFLTGEVFTWSEEDKLKMIKQIVTGLDYLHSNKIIHHDLKPENIVILNGKYKIIDFGLSERTKSSIKSSVKTASKHQHERITRKDKADTTDIGSSGYTEQYVSPEKVYAPLRVSSKSDIFSLGIILFEMFEGLSPWNGQGGVVYGKTEKLPEFDNKDKYSTKTYNLIRSCLAYQPEHRPSAKELLIKLSKFSILERYDELKNLIYNNSNENLNFINEINPPEKIFLFNTSNEIGKIHFQESNLFSNENKTSKEKKIIIIISLMLVGILIGFNIIKMAEIVAFENKFWFYFWYVAPSILLPSIYWFFTSAERSVYYIGERGFSIISIKNNHKMKPGINNYFYDNYQNLLLVITKNVKKYPLNDVDDGTIYKYIFYKNDIKTNQTFKIEVGISKDEEKKFKDWSKEEYQINKDLFFMRKVELFYSLNKIEQWIDEYREKGIIIFNIDKYQISFNEGQLFYCSKKNNDNLRIQIIFIFQGKVFFELEDKKQIQIKISDFPNYKAFILLFKNIINKGGKNGQA